MKFVLLVLVVYGQKINYYVDKQVVFGSYEECYFVSSRLNREESKKKSNVIFMCSRSNI